MPLGDGADMGDTPIEVLSVYSIQERLKFSSKIFGACISIEDPGIPAPEGLRESAGFLLELRFHDIVKRNEMEAARRAEPTGEK